MIPYVVGPWVRGDRFYGRDALMSEVLAGERDRIWLAGMRRVGKTSLLRQIEHLAGLAPDPAYFPIVWDLEGSDDAKELDCGLHDALLDAAPGLADLGVSLPRQPEPASDAVARLVRALSARHRRLLVLCDEAEELVGLIGRAPELREPLERSLAGARVVLASSVRAATAADGAAAALRSAFGMPVWLGPLEPRDARALLRQDKRPEALRPKLAPEDLELLSARCGGHPLLLQLAAKRTAETGDARSACERLAEEATVGHLFEVDLSLLEEADRRLLVALAQRSGSGLEIPSAVDARLRALGLIRDVDGEPEPGNWFLARHLAAL